MRELLTKEQVSRQLWLLYFNRVLLEKGLLSEANARKMRMKILNTTTAPGRGSR